MATASQCYAYGVGYSLHRFFYTSGLFRDHVVGLHHRPAIAIWVTLRATAAIKLCKSASRIGMFASKHFFGVTKPITVLF